MYLFYSEYQSYTYTTVYIVIPYYIIRWTCCPFYLLSPYIESTWHASFLVGINGEVLIIAVSRRVTISIGCTHCLV